MLRILLGSEIFIRDTPQRRPAAPETPAPPKQNDTEPE